MKKTSFKMRFLQDYTHFQEMVNCIVVIESSKELCSINVLT